MMGTCLSSTESLCLCFYNGRFAVSDSVCDTFLDLSSSFEFTEGSRLVVLLLFVFEAGAGLWHHTCLFVEAMTHLPLQCIVKGCCRAACSNLLHFVRIHRGVTVCTLLSLFFLLSSSVSVWTQWFMSGLKNISCIYLAVLKELCSLKTLFDVSFLNDERHGWKS